MYVEENRNIVHMYEAKLVRIWDKIRQLEVTKMSLNTLVEVAIDCTNLCYLFCHREGNWFHESKSKIGCVNSK
jgi:hypothetical protein